MSHPDLIVPATGRPALAALLDALTGYPGRVLLVDDRSSGAPLQARGHEVLRSGGRGPAAARNVGWRAAGTDWTAFLDDDVVPAPGWADALLRDLDGLGPLVAASQGRIAVPQPGRPTDWERNVGGLAGARWATADMAFRRSALEALGGFDERFPRAYREDAELGLRVLDRGLALAQGERTVTHPVGAAPWTVSVRKQRGNQDDALMTALHGRGWRGRAGAPSGRFARHAAITASGIASLALSATRDRRAAAAAGLAWAAGTAEFAWARIAPGPRTRAEVGAMLATSAVLPAAATGHRLAGVLRARRLAGTGAPVPAPPLAVLLDRDDTLIHDVPYNGDPSLVLARPGVSRALARLRGHGVKLAIVSNQSGIARGLLTPEQVTAVTGRVEELLGPFDDVRWCPHGPEDGCGCRKPAPGMLLAAAAALEVDPLRCAMVGDIGADVQAARAAGMRGILVPTGVTRPEEVAAAAETAPTVEAAVARLLAGAPVPAPRVEALA